MQYAAQVDVLHDALAEKDGIIKAKASELKHLRDTNSSIQSSHQRDQVLVRRLESRLSEVELEKSNAQDAHRGGQYGQHLPVLRLSSPVGHTIGQPELDGAQHQT